MNITGRLKSVNAKTTKSGSEWAAAITFRVETDYTHENFDEADILNGTDCAISVGEHLSFSATCTGASAVTRVAVAKSEDSDTEGVERENVLAIKFSLPYTSAIFKSIGACQDGEDQEIFIRELQPDMFEGAGAQSAAGA